MLKTRLGQEEKRNMTIGNETAEAGKKKGEGKSKGRGGGTQRRRLKEGRKKI